MPQTFDPYASQSRKTTIWVASGALALLAVAALGLGGASVLSRQGADGQSITARPGAETEPMLAQGSDPSTSLLERQELPNPSTLAREGLSSQPSLQQGVPTVAGMPAHIRAWLEHLEEIEDRKVELTEDQTAQAMTAAAGGTLAGLGDLLGEALGEPDSTPDSSAAEQALLDSKQWIADWQALIRRYNSAQPPPECARLAGAYSEHLGEVSVYMGQIGAAFESFQSTDRSRGEASEAISDLMEMQRNSKDIDAAGRDAAELLDDVFRRYDVSAWFGIDPDPGDGFGGMLGIG